MDALTLYELNNLVHDVLEQTLREDYWLQAELSEVRTAYNGHCYVEFVQKDRNGQNLIAKARGTIWAPTYRLLAPFFERETGQPLSPGLKVLVCVSIKFHELYGYSLTVTDIDPTYTLGDLARRRREILKKLSDDGILNDNKALSLPLSANRIAVVSSASAAGYGDFCDQLLHNESGFYFHIGLFEAIMQGTRTETSVLSALDAILAQCENWDAVVIIRGGGATSDLSAFDSYDLAAACAQFPLPVITGIGHERDDTVLDYVAHTRVKTPTAAAAFLIAHQQQAAEQLSVMQNRLKEVTDRRVTDEMRRMERVAERLHRVFNNVCTTNENRMALLAQRLATAQNVRLITAAQKLSSHEGRLQSLFQVQLQRAALSLDLLEQRCRSLNPDLLLKRGYSLTLKNGHIVRRTSDLNAGDVITTRLADGEIQSVIKT